MVPEEVVEAYKVRIVGLVHVIQRHSHIRVQCRNQQPRY